MWIQKFDCIIVHMPGHIYVIHDGGSRLAAPLKFYNLSSLNGAQVEENVCEVVGGSSHFTGNNLMEALEEFTNELGRGARQSCLFSNMVLGIEPEYNHSLFALSRETMLI